MAVTPAARLKARALELGFDDARIASVEPLEAAAHYEAWLAAGFHGGMRWLAGPKHRERRANPERVCRDQPACRQGQLAHLLHGHDLLFATAGRLAVWPVNEVPLEPGPDQLNRPHA